MGAREERSLHRKWAIKLGCVVNNVQIGDTAIRFEAAG